MVRNLKKSILETCLRADLQHNYRTYEKNIILCLFSKSKKTKYTPGIFLLLSLLMSCTIRLSGFSIEEPLGAMNQSLHKKLDNRVLLDRKNNCFILIPDKQINLGF